MDQRQRNLLSSAEMAERIDFEALAGFLRLMDLVSEKKISEIKAKIEDPFVRTKKLLDALQESDSDTAFDTFIKFLEITKNDEALKLIPTINKQGSVPHYIMKLLYDRYFKPNQQRYPLGMYSGTPSVKSPLSPAGDGHVCFQGADSAFSPFKERHQATLISSSGAGAANTRVCDSSSNQHFRRNSTTDSNNPAPLIDRCTITPPTNSYQNNGGCFRLRETRPQTTAQLSQTSTRPHELSLMNIPSLTDRRSNHSDAENEVSWHPYAQVHSAANQDAHGASSPHCCHPSHGSASPSESDSSSDSLIIEHTSLILNSNVTMAVTRDGPNAMHVKTATVCHNNPEEDYKMTADPRGLCLIVNNIEFEGEIFPTRKGSDQDAERFDKIFKQLGFEVILRRNLTADQMREAFKDLASGCSREHDALFVFILSHGSEHGIYGTDGMEVYLESEILTCFDNKHCKAMLGKPKVFVIQACRGRSKDCGGDGDMTDSIAWPPVVASPTVKAAPQRNRVPTSWLPTSQPHDGKQRKHPIRTDMLLIFSCLAGYVSVRNELAGSWLGVALAYFIMTHAHERDLLRILNLVTSDVISRESSTGHIQSIELKLLGWTKNLYFNPGIVL